MDHRHHNRVSSEVSKSFDYQHLRKDISGLFDVISLDKKNFKYFKQILHEEAFKD
jgi:hypothetical protein